MMAAPHREPFAFDCNIQKPHALCLVPGKVLTIKCPRSNTGVSGPVGSFSPIHGR